MTTLIPSKVIGLDLETDGLSVVRGEGRIWCVSLWSPEYEFHSAWHHHAIDHIQELIDDGFVFAIHNAAFDVAAIEAHTGLTIPYICTQVLAHAINPQLDSFSLAALSGGEKIDYGKEMTEAGLWTTKDTADLYRIPYNPIMARYNTKDAKLAYEQWEEGRLHLEQDERLCNSFFTVSNPFVRVIMSMHGGIQVDSAKMSTLLGDVNVAFQSKVAELITEYPRIVKIKWDKENRMWVATDKTVEPSISSPNDVTSLLISNGWVPDEFNRDTGRPVTSQNVLRRLVAEPSTPPQLRHVAEMIQDIRQLYGIQNKLLEILKIVVASNRENIYPSWHQTGTVTSRLSCSKPALQNMPVRYPVLGQRTRECFVPPDGFSMLVGDLSQIELGILAYYLELLCGDSSMAEATREARDLHDANTENWYNLTKDDEEFSTKRKIAKNGIFASNYGAGAKRVALTLNISIAEATEILNAVNSNLPLDELKAIFWQTLGVSRDIRPIRNGYTSYTSGVFYDVMGVRHFYPDILSRDRWRKQSAERESFNCLMQGGCASIFISLCTKLLTEVVAPRLGWIASTVHDEVIFYVPTIYAETALVGANRIFNELVLPTPQGGVNIRADFKIVNNWGKK